MHPSRLRRASFIALIVFCTLLLATSALAWLRPAGIEFHDFLAPLTILAALSLASWLYCGKRIREEDQTEIDG